MITNAAVNFLKERYFRNGEDWSQLCTRVSSFLGNDEQEKQEYYDMIFNCRALPNSPTLMNAGTPNGYLSACNLLPVPDSLEGIMEAAKSSALTQKHGGGVGFNFSGLRPTGDSIGSTGGTSSGVVSFLKLFDIVGQVIKQGGKRRSANLGLLRYDHPDILRWIAAKNENGVLSTFNLSIAVTDEFFEKVNNDEIMGFVNPRTGKHFPAYDPVLESDRTIIRARELFNRIAKSMWDYGEPGLVFWDTLQRGNPTPHLGEINGVNPCITGDTLIAVADGRNHVPIQQLAEEGKDVMVYTYDGDRTRIGIGRNPRKTIKSQDIYMVTLDDGSSFNATSNHRIMLRNGLYVEVKDLKIKYSLMPFNRWEYSQKGRKTKYWAIGTNERKRLFLSEHRMIKEKLGYDESIVVHHKDFDGQNNSINNLEFLTSKEHGMIHDISGDKNPMRFWWNNASEEEKQTYRKKMSISTSGERNGRYGKPVSEETRVKKSRSMKKYYAEYPEKKKEISISLSEWFKEHGTEHLKYEKSKRVEFECPVCGSKTIMTESLASRRTVCSLSCANTFNKTGTGITYDEMIEHGKEFVDIMDELPTHGKWEKFSKDNNHIPSRELVRKHFGGFPQFREAIEVHNHRVTSIEYIGKEDVYNLTVDDYHNYAIITNPNAVTSGKGLEKHSGIIISNCGESPLRYGESCCLGSVNLFEHMDGKRIDIDKIRDTVRMMVRMLNAVIDKNVYPLPLIEEETKRTRKIGVGIMGFADVLGRMGIRYGSQKSIDLIHTIMSAIKETARSESELLASKYGTYPACDSDTRVGMRNATVLSIAPTGSISIISSVSSGAEPFFKIFYQLNREKDKEPITVFAKSFMEALKDVDKEHLIADMMAHDYSPLQMIERGHLDESFNHFVTTNEVTPNEHVMVQAAFQRYVDMAISKTINMKKEGTLDEVVEALHLAHSTNCKGITVYRDDCERGSFLSKISCESCGSKELAHSEGCVRCKKCGISLCAVS